MRTKTANEIRTQAKRLHGQLKIGVDSSRIRLIADIGRKYLHNIANHYGMSYGPKTWEKIGNNKLSSEIYAK